MEVSRNVADSSGFSEITQKCMLLLLGNGRRGLQQQLPSSSLGHRRHAHGYGSASSRRGGGGGEEEGEASTTACHGYNAEALASILRRISCCCLCKEERGDIFVLLRRQQGRALHSLILLEGRGSDKLLCNLIIRMYGKLGCMRDALATFHASRALRNAFTWAIIISMYADHGLPIEAFHAYEQMLSECVLPDKAILSSIISACTQLPHHALREGKRFHCLIVSLRFRRPGHGNDLVVDDDDDDDEDHVLATILLSMYGKCKRIDLAQEVFAEMYTRNLVSWNAMMSVYVDCGMCMKVHALMARMQAEGFLPDRITLVSNLDACADDHQGSLLLGRRLHTVCLHCSSASDVITGTALINMYAKCGSIEAARAAFEGLAEQDIISRSVMISAYVRHGHASDASQLFRQTLLEGEAPNVVIAISILESCSDAQEGARMHVFMLSRGLAEQDMAGNALMKLYGKFGQLLAAERAFDDIAGARDIISWTEMMKVCAQQGQYHGTLKHYGQMMMECAIPDGIAILSLLETCPNPEAFVDQGKRVHSSCMGRDLGLVGNPLASALIGFYGKCGHLGEARGIVFETSTQDVVSWCALMKAHINSGHGEDAFRLFARMEREGLEADRVCLITILDVCTCNSALREGKLVHNRITEMGLELDQVVGTGLVAMYGKCGSLEDARRAFEKLSKPGIISWNAIIGAHAEQGAVKQSLRLFSQMQEQGCVPDHGTFQNLLSAFRHGGLIEEGIQLFLSISHGYGYGYGIKKPSLDHFNSLADLLARAGLLEKSESLIESMPCNPNSSSWIALMSACKQHIDAIRAADAAAHVFDLDPRSPSPYVLLSNIFAMNNHKRVA